MSEEWTVTHCILRSWPVCSTFLWDGILGQLTSGLLKNESPREEVGHEVSGCTGCIKPFLSRMNWNTGGLTLPNVGNRENSFLPTCNPSLNGRARTDV